MREELKSKFAVVDGKLLKHTVGRKPAGGRDVGLKILLRSVRPIAGFLCPALEDVAAQIRMVRSHPMRSRFSGDLSFNLRHFGHEQAPLPQEEGSDLGCEFSAVLGDDGLPDGARATGQEKGRLDTLDLRRVVQGG